MSEFAILGSAAAGMEAQRAALDAAHQRVRLDRAGLQRLAPGEGQ